MTLLLLPAQFSVADQRTEASVTIGGVTVRLAEPSLASVDNVRSKIESVIGGRRYRDFARDSVFAPVHIKLSYVENDQGRRVGHRVHVALIVQEKLENLQSETYVRQLFPEDSSADEVAEAVSAENLKLRNVTDAGDQVQYRRLQTRLLERVQLDCVVRFQMEAGSDYHRIDFRVDDRFDNRWNSRDKSGSYKGLRGWIYTSPTDEGTVFVEVRLLFSEPEDWFQGSNFLRSKLPLALQEVARDFRRKLADRK